MKKKARPPTQRELAEAVGISIDTVKEILARHKMAPRDDLKKWAAWHATIARDNPLKVGSRNKQTAGEASLAKLIAQAKKEQMLADTAEEKLKILKGRYIPREEIERQLEPLVKEFQDLIDRVFVRDFAPVAIRFGNVEQYKAAAKDRFDQVVKSINQGISRTIEDAGKSLDQSPDLSADSNVTGTIVSRGNPGQGKGETRKSRMAKKRITKKLDG